MSIGKIGEPLTLRFPLSAGEYHMLRFDPINKAGTVTLSSAHIVDRHGTVVLPILPQQFQASQQIHSLTVVGDGVQVTTVDGAYDPTLTLGLSYPLTLRTPLPYPLNKPWGMFLWVFILCSGGLWLADYLLVRWHDSALRLCQHVSSWAGEHPKTVILAAAVLATIASCYPVLLYGKSFVSRTTVRCYSTIIGRRYLARWRLRQKTRKVLILRLCCLLICRTLGLKARLFPEILRCRCGIAPLPQGYRYLVRANRCSATLSTHWFC